MDSNGTHFTLLHLALSSSLLLRILSKFIPSGSRAYGDDVFAYLFDVCSESEEEVSIPPPPLASL
jgi:hypothetical protein